MVFTGFVVTNILRFILRAPRVNTEVLSASIAVYFMIGLLGALNSQLPPLPPVQNLNSRNEQEQTEGTEEHGSNPLIPPVQ